MAKITKVTKIMIAGCNIGGFGGMETVFNSFSQLLKGSDENYQITFMFFNELNNTVDDTWLGNNTFLRLNSSIKNRKLKRISLAFNFSLVINKIKPDYIIAYDSIGCYISRLALRFSFKNTPLFSWNHFSVKGSYKEKYLLLADKHLSISNGISGQLEDLGVKRSDIYTIFNPVSPQEISIPSGDTTNFLYVGRVFFGGQKNLNELFRALSDVHGKWHLHIVGSGDEIEISQLKKLAEELKINNNIIWHGWQTAPWEYIKDKIRYVSALVLTSTYEGLPMVLCEANSYGIYTISSDCPTGPVDIIKPGVNGNLYTMGDIRSLTSYLNDIITKKINNSHEITKSAITQFYNDSYINKLLTIFK